MCLSIRRISNKIGAGHESGKLKRMYLEHVEDSLDSASLGFQEMDVLSPANLPIRGLSIKENK